MLNVRIVRPGVDRFCRTFYAVYGVGISSDKDTDAESLTAIATGFLDLGEI